MAVFEEVAEFVGLEPDLPADLVERLVGQGISPTEVIEVYTDEQGRIAGGITLYSLELEARDLEQDADKYARQGNVTTAAWCRQNAAELRDAIERRDVAWLRGYIDEGGTCDPRLVDIESVFELFTEHWVLRDQLQKPLYRRAACIRPLAMHFFRPLVRPREHRSRSRRAGSRTGPARSSDDPPRPDLGRARRRGAA